MIKLANSIALPLGTSQESSDFKAFLESILPPEPEYGEPCPDSNKFYHCYELMDEDGHISADKLIEIYGIEHASTFAVFSMFFNLTRDMVNNAPKVKAAVDCLSSLVEQHARNNKLDLRDQGLIVHDFIPTVLLSFMGCFAGITSFTKWADMLNINPSLRGALCALLPELLAPPYDYRPECMYRMVAMFAGTYYQNDAQNRASGVQAINAFFLHLRKEQLMTLEPLTKYSPEHGFLAGQFFSFTKPRFCVLGFDGQEIRASFLPNEATSRTGYTSVNLFDCTHRRYIDFRVRTKKNHEAEAFIEMLENLKQFMPMSNVVFVADALNTTPAVINAIEKAKSYYLLIVKSNGVNKPIRIQSLRLLDANQDSEALHLFLSPERKVSGRREQVLVQAIKIERCLQPKLTLDEEQLSAVLGRTIEDTYPSAVSLIRYDKTSKEERANYSKEGLEALNARYENDKEFVKRHQLMITNIDVDQPENFDKLLCALNERWLYETAHYIVDENLNQDRLQMSNEQRLYMRLGWNKISADALSHTRELLFEERKNTPARGLKRRCASRPPSYDVVRGVLTDPLKLVEHICNFVCDVLKLDEANQKKI